MTIIELNSYRRSGSNFIQRNLETNKLRVIKTNWTRLHKLNKFGQNSIYSVCILRNPKDAICSDTVMNSFDKDFNEDSIKISIESQLKEYAEFLNIFTDKINFLIPFLFEQLESNPEKVLYSIFSICDDKKNNFIFNNIIPENKKIKNANNETVVFLHTSKQNEKYEKVCNFFDENFQIDKILIQYNILIKKIIERQKNLAITI